MSTVKVGTRQLSSVELVAYGQGIHDSVDGNVFFPTPTPTMAALQTGIDELIAANAAVDQNPGPKERQARREKDKVVRAQLKQLAGYVQSSSAGDESKILSSGFAVVKRGSPIGRLDPPGNLRDRLTRNTGEVALEWDRERGVDLHHVYMSTTSAPFAWTLVGVTTKRRFNVEQLTPGTFYWFAVTAIGAAGESSKSAELEAMAAA